MSVCLEWSARGTYLRVSVALTCGVCQGARVPLGALWAAALYFGLSDVLEVSVLWDLGG
jgi:hypothetical protein